MQERRAVFGKEGLIAAVQINDLQADGP